MTNKLGNVLYKDTSERELENMWEDIKGNNITNLNRSLLKDIDKNDTQVKTESLPVYRKEMYDSEEGEWVPFDIRGASYIINERNEKLRMRMMMPMPSYNEFGALIYSWKPYDSSYLQSTLKDKTYKVPKLAPVHSQDIQEWLQMIKQDHQEYRDEGRYDEIPGGRSGYERTEI
jgi:hypothetical protein